MGSMLAAPRRAYDTYARWHRCLVAAVVLLLGLTACALFTRLYGSAPEAGPALGAVVLACALALVDVVLRALFRAAHGPPLPVPGTGGGPGDAEQARDLALRAMMLDHMARQVAGTAVEPLPLAVAQALGLGQDGVPGVAPPLPSPRRARRQREVEAPPVSVDECFRTLDDDLVPISNGADTFFLAGAGGAGTRPRVDTSRPRSPATVEVQECLRRLDALAPVRCGG